MLTLPRRRALHLAGVAALATGAGRVPAQAEDKIVTIGMSFPLTGSLALQAGIARDAAVFAIDEVSAKGGLGGYKLRTLILDDASTTTGQYDPALAATNARKMLGDPTVVAAVGPLNSGSAKAVTPVLSQGGMATISGSATNPDLTNPKFASLYRPGGKPVFFRTVTTDAYQGPNLANYFAETLKVKKIFVLDDGGAYGVGMADAFAAQAAKKGMEVVIRDRLDPLNADYNAIVTKAKSLGVQGLYYGGDPAAGSKLAKQSYDILPAIPKGGGDGVHTPDMLTGTGMPAIQGWYATSAAAHVLEEPSVQAWAKRYKAKMNQEPADYTVTYYDAAQVIIDAIGRVAKGGKPMTRDNVRDAIQATNLKTLQGDISFDENGDTTSKVVSIYQVKFDDKFPLGDVVHQFEYVGVAPQA
ncbi:MAG TPA: branched-chain amino acid ABC transporter substrate-binding protein [Acetobacteraceae bacterium]|jgi:branched-chain amino acid transport system substrate-binding protein|nr:branched-chain amino acid ABC transporter substrate-binding protein [Acetobacteraceae bacterium]